MPPFCHFGRTPALSANTARFPRWFSVRRRHRAGVSSLLETFKYRAGVANGCISLGPAPRIPTIRNRGRAYLLAFASITFEREELRKNWHGIVEIDWLDLLPLRGERPTTRKIRQIRFRPTPFPTARSFSLAFSYFNLAGCFEYRSPAPVKFFHGIFATV